MTESVYEKLADALRARNIPYGGSGPVEKIPELWPLLEHFWTPEEAEIAAKMPLESISAEDLASEIGADTQVVERHLMAMMLKGLVSPMGYLGGVAHDPSSKVPKYVLMTTMPGSFEHELTSGKFDDSAYELARVYSDYFTAIARLREEGNPAPVATVPLSRVMCDENVLPAEGKIEPWDRYSKYINEMGMLAIVGACYCRHMADLKGYPASKPKQLCFAFGAGPVTEEMKSAIRAVGCHRLSTKEEMIRAIDAAHEAGLVSNVTNCQDAIAYMCVCGMQHCVTLRGTKAVVVTVGPAPSSFMVVVDEAKCIACGRCVERCQFEAMSIEGGFVERDANRCFGCGLCVSTCPTSALSMVRRERPPIPAKNFEELNKLMGDTMRSTTELPHGDTGYYVFLNKDRITWKESATVRMPVVRDDGVADWAPL
jgi:electron transport complex protein RnfB